MGAVLVKAAASRLALEFWFAQQCPPLNSQDPNPSLMCVTPNHKPPTHQHAFVWDKASNCNAIG
jgi:hypothetical protein